MRATCATRRPRERIFWQDAPVRDLVDARRLAKTAVCGRKRIGRRARELAFAGRVRFLDEEREVEILLTELETPLIGTALLDECRLTIDFANETVDLKSKRKTPRR